MTQQLHDLSRQHWLFPGSGRHYCEQSRAEERGKAQNIGVDDAFFFNEDNLSLDRVMVEQHVFLLITVPFQGEVSTSNGPSSSWKIDELIQKSSDGDFT